MPARGTEISPVPVLGTTPLRAQPRSNTVRRCSPSVHVCSPLFTIKKSYRSPNAYPQPVQLRTSLYNFVQDKKFSAGPTPTFLCSRLPLNEPEQIGADPENQRLMPEHEPERSGSFHCRRPNPAHFNISNRTPRHFKHFNPDPKNLRPFQLFRFVPLCSAKKFVRTAISAQMPLLETRTLQTI